MWIYTGRDRRNCLSDSLPGSDGEQASREFLRCDLCRIDLQGQRPAVIRRSLLPAWFVEGMAYSLSQDPRAPLAEPWESHRHRFAAWYGSIAKDQLWETAGKL